MSSAVTLPGTTADPSTTRPPDRHNHPNQPATTGRSLGPRKEAGQKFSAGALLRMTILKFMNDLVEAPLFPCPSDTVWVTASQAAEKIDHISF